LLTLTFQPAGVGIGRDPPIYLKSGDEVSVSISGLGRLTNRIAPQDAQNPTAERVEKLSIPRSLPANKKGLVVVGEKPLHVKQSGDARGPPAIFVHGLGGSLDYWTPIVELTKLKSSYNCVLFDLEGHGLSPTSPLSKLSIASFAADVKNLASHFGVSSGLTLVAHSMGCLVALKAAQDNPGLVSKLILVGPPPNPLPDAASKGSHARADLVRAEGMGAVVDAVCAGGTSQKTKDSNPVARTAVRLSLLGQSGEGYAKACSALAEATEAFDLENIKAETLIVTGAEDKVSSAEVCEGYKKRLPNVVGVEVLQDVGHWHVFEDAQGVAQAVGKML
jgi:pimeloyl-ACP methyl ester carboxylesterase